MKYKKKPIERISLIFGIYILIIFIFAGFYLSSGNDFSKPIVEYSQALYFSVVTITTLGYGDIYPTSNATKILISFQTLYGILTFGLFMNASAIKMAELSQQRQKAAAKSHMKMEYEYFREQTLNIILGVGQESHDPKIRDIYEEISGEKKLTHYHTFRRFFLGGTLAKPIFYEFQNRLNDTNSDVLSETYLELDILSDNIKYLLSKVETQNREAHDVLMRVAHAPTRYKKSYVYMHDQGKYVGQLIFELMASYSTASGALESDFIEEAIDNL